MKKIFILFMLVIVAFGANAQGEKIIKSSYNSDTVTRIVENQSDGVSRYVLIQGGDTAELKMMNGKLYFKDSLDNISLAEMATYTNVTPVPYNVGNISSGTTFNKSTFAEIIEKLLYTEVPPTASLSGGSILEYGDPNLAKTLTWSATRGSEDISSITISNTSCAITPTGNNQSGTCSDTLVQDVAQSYTLTVVGFEKSASNSTSFSWRYANYYGAITQDTATFYGLIRSGNQPSDYLTKRLATNKSENHNYDCTGGKYIYVLYPASYGNPVVVKNGVNDFSDYTITNLVITDDWGVNRSYKAFSVNSIQTGSTVNINIQN